jgi:uncharacterized protein (TIGR04255 family)
VIREALDMPPTLKNPPLVEALLELKWKLEEASPGVLHDPVFPLFLGRFHERIRGDYPSVESLPTVHAPDEFTPYLVKYRFRRSPDGWPLVQAGPGVATLNFTERYDWKSFSAAADHFTRSLFESYAVEGDKPRLQLSSSLLRYINAVPLSQTGSDVLSFIKRSLHTEISLGSDVACSDVVSGPARAVDLLVNFPLKTPTGGGLIRIASGSRMSTPSLLWDLQVTSADDESPKSEAEVAVWLSQAHDVVESWFFALVRGELLDQFQRG